MILKMENKLKTLFIFSFQLLLFPLISHVNLIITDTSMNNLFCLLISVSTKSQVMCCYVPTLKNNL